MSAQDNGISCTFYRSTGCTLCRIDRLPLQETAEGIASMWGQRSRFSPDHRAPLTFPQILGLSLDPKGVVPELWVWQHGNNGEETATRREGRLRRVW